MARPRPLESLVSGRATNAGSYESLTPRTPHSRMGYAEEGHTPDRSQFQTDPLLSSSASHSFPESSKGPKRRKAELSSFTSRVFYYFPLALGGVVALALLGFAVVSWKSPGYLLNLFGIQSDAWGTTTESTSIPSRPHHHVNSSQFISYEKYTRFPLSPTEYRQECDKIQGGLMHHSGYWEPMNMGPSDVPHTENKDHSKICSSTITYMLDGHVGLVADLSLLSQIAALARERNRTLLVDDTYWNRGKWLDHFQDVRLTQPGPEPNCVPPPADELVACPRLARHWVINSRTAIYHLGHAFSEQYEDAYARDLNRLKPIFQRAVESFRTTIKPNTHNAGLIKRMREEISEILSTAVTTHEPYIALHIRWGDLLGQSWKYRDRHLPVSLFMDGARDVWSRLCERHDSGVTVEAPSEPRNIYIASDDPSAQKEYIRGFKSTRFFSLARSRDYILQSLASPRGYIQSEFDSYTDEERIRLTRGVLVDLEMMSGMWAREGDIRPEGVVCGIGSTICRIAAVGFGWKSAFGLEDGDHDDGSWGQATRRWTEVDARGSITPMWEPFRLF